MGFFFPSFQSRNSPHRQRLYSPGSVVGKSSVSLISAQECEHERDVRQAPHGWVLAQQRLEQSGHPGLPTQPSVDERFDLQRSKGQDLQFLCRTGDWV